MSVINLIQYTGGEEHWGEKPSYLRQGHNDFGKAIWGFNFENLFGTLNIEVDISNLIRIKLNRRISNLFITEFLPLNFLIIE